LCFGLTEPSISIGPSPILNFRCVVASRCFLLAAAGEDFLSLFPYVYRTFATGAVVDDDARGGDVAKDCSAGFDLDAFARFHIAGYRAVDDDFFCSDISLYATGFADAQRRIYQFDGPLDRAFGDEIFVSRDLAFDAQARPYIAAAPRLLRVFQFIENLAHDFRLNSLAQNACSAARTIVPYVLLILIQVEPDEYISRFGKRAAIALFTAALQGSSG